MISLNFIDIASSFAHFDEDDTHLVIEGMTTSVEFSDVGVPGLTGPTGPSASSIRIDVPLSANWIIPNPLGRIPIVRTYLESGEIVAADITATPQWINVVFAEPHAGFVVIF